jgi:hypothetical protein
VIADKTHYATFLTAAIQTKKSPPASIPDVYVIKQTVAPKSKPVGSQFTFTIEVGVKGLSTAVARNVVLEDEVPAGLLLDSAQEITTPGEKGGRLMRLRGRGHRHTEREE